MATFQFGRAMVRILARPSRTKIAPGETKQDCSVIEAYQNCTIGYFPCS